jgi:hypothetical protein
MLHPARNRNMDLSQLDLLQLLEQVEELHPLAFRRAFGLTHEEAAKELCLEPQTMRSYSKKEPSKRVKKLAATIAKQWISDKRQLVDTQALIESFELIPR